MTLFIGYCALVSVATLAWVPFVVWAARTGGDRPSLARYDRNYRAMYAGIVLAVAWVAMAVLAPVAFASPA